MQSTGLKLLEEKKEIDDILSYDENIVKDIMSQYNSAVEKHANNPLLQSFIIGGVWFVSVVYEFSLPMIKFLLFLFSKYPPAIYIYLKKCIISYPDEYKSISCARPDEVFDVLSGMDISDAELLLQHCEGLGDEKVLILCNALSTEDKRAFLNDFPLEKKSKSFLKAIKLGRITIKNYEISWEVLNVFIHSVISKDDAYYVYRELIKSDHIENDNVIEGYRNELQARQNLLHLLKQCNEEETLKDVLTNGYDINKWKEFAEKDIEGLLIAIVSFFSFVNDPEAAALDEILNHRDGLIQISIPGADNEEISVLSIRNLVDQIDARLFPPENEEEANDVIDATQDCINNDLKLIKPMEYSECYLTMPPMLNDDQIHRIASALAGTDGITTKNYLRPTDIPRFCYFFANGRNICKKEMDFSYPIHWYGSVASLRFVIMLLFGVRNKTEIAQKNINESERYARYFEFDSLKAPRSDRSEKAALNAFRKGGDLSEVDKGIILDKLSPILGLDKDAFVKKY